MRKHFRVLAIRQSVLGVVVALGFGLVAGPVMSAEGLDPEADKILRSMSDYMGGLSAFSMNANIDDEVVDLDGQKLQISSSAKFVFARPGEFHVQRKGAFADVEFIFDGKTLILNSKSINAYLQIEGPKTIDEATRTVAFETGLDIPSAELLGADPYTDLVANMLSSNYRGTVYVNGIECHYMSFRTALVDWQLWVSAGDKPLPMKYVITSKWVTAAPQYSIRFQDWNSNPEIKAGQFSFSAPKNAKKLDSMPVNALGEITQLRNKQ